MKLMRSALTLPYNLSPIASFPFSNLFTNPYIDPYATGSRVLMWDTGTFPSVGYV